MAAGIGAYLYTALEAVVLPIGPGERPVQCLRRNRRRDLLTLSPATERWLRDGYPTRMQTDAVLRDLGPILAHGEPEHAMGQGEQADAAARSTSDDVATPAAPAPEANSPVKEQPNGNGRGELVTIDLGSLGPQRPDAA